MEEEEDEDEEIGDMNFELIFFIFGCCVEGGGIGVGVDGCF